MPHQSVSVVKGIFKKRFCIITTLFLVVFIAGLYFPVFNVEALDDLYEEQDELEERMEQEESQLQEYRTREEKLEAEIEQLDRQVQETRREISRLEGEIDQTEQEIEETEIELAQAEEELAHQEELLTKRLRAMQERGTSSYLEVLLSSTSFGDFLTRFNDLRTIAERDADLLEEVEQERDRIQLVKEDLEDQKDELEGLRQEAEEQRDELDFALVSRQDTKSELEQEIKEREKAIAEMEREAEELEELIEKRIAEKGGQFDGENLLWPVDGASYVTSGFGYRTHPIFGGQRWHGGIDIGTHGRRVPIIAAAAGQVSISQYSRSYGNYVMVSHGGGVATLYAHLHERMVSEGETVTRGQQIGRAGTTGFSTGIHLHFEVHDYNRDPLRSYQPNDHRHDPYEYGFD